MLTNDDFEIESPKPENQCGNSLCDMVWIGKTAKWKRNVPKGEDALVCEACAGRIFEIGEISVGYDSGHVS